MVPLHLQVFRVALPVRFEPVPSGWHLSVQLERPAVVDVAVFGVGIFRAWRDLLLADQPAPVALRPGAAFPHTTPVHPLPASAVYAYEAASMQLRILPILTNILAGNTLLRHVGCHVLWAAQALHAVAWDSPGDPNGLIGVARAP